MTFKDEHAKRYEKSATNPLLQLMLIFGISWLTAKSMPKWAIVLIAVYNVAVFLGKKLTLLSIKHLLV
jgi:hypothetical protein